MTRGGLKRGQRECCLSEVVHANKAQGKWAALARFSPRLQIRISS